eukprot:4422640-Amphidinium_carterae.2
MHPSWIEVTAHFHTAFVSFTNPVAQIANWPEWIRLAHRVLGTKKSIFLGYRATRQAGTSVATDLHERDVTLLNDWARGWIPEKFRWNSIAVVSYANVTEHVDGSNTIQSIVLTLSSDRTSQPIH